MVERGEGVIGITGATASLRGRPIASAFAPAKVKYCFKYKTATARIRAVRQMASVYYYASTTR